jgi:uncharacterized membrane protein
MQASTLEQEQAQRLNIQPNNMADHLHNELKKEFQLERMILFSDAVFAIAITLLVIEIKVPEIEKHEVNDRLLLQALGHLIPKFMGFLISFMIIGLYWTIHHRMFGYVVNYTRRTMVLNLMFLFAVALMPFSTAFYSEYILRLLITPMMVYVFNISLLGILNFMLWKHISNKKNNLAEGITDNERKLFSIRAVLVPCIFTISAITYLFNPKFAVFFPPFIPLSMRAINKFYKAKQVRGKMISKSL